MVYPTPCVFTGEYEKNNNNKKKKMKRLLKKRRSGAFGFH